MKRFTREEIDGVRTHFRNQGYQEIYATLGSREFSYFIVPQSLRPDIPNFVIRLTGEIDDGYVLGISDSVDARQRPYAVAHEFIEFIEIGIDTPDRCTRALDEELELVPEDIKPGYVRMRRDFFRDFIPLASDQPQFYTEDDLRQLRENLKRLEELSK